MVALALRRPYTFIVMAIPCPYRGKIRVISVDLDRHAMQARGPERRFKMRSAVTDRLIEVRDARPAWKRRSRDIVRMHIRMYSTTCDSHGTNASARPISRSTGLISPMLRKVFDGPMVLFEDLREDYGEQRMIGIGLLGTLVVLVAHVESDETIHIISMRKADNDETNLYYQNAGQLG